MRCPKYRANRKSSSRRVNVRDKGSKIAQVKFMVQMTVQLPDDLAVKIQPLGRWLPAILKLSSLGFKTLAAASAMEVQEFLLRNPTPQEFLSFYISEQSQERSRHLLALNSEGLLSEAEELEMDELGRLEHLVIRLKAQIAKQLQSQP